MTLLYILSVDLQSLLCFRIKRHKDVIHYLNHIPFVSWPVTCSLDTVTNGMTGVLLPMSDQLTCWDHGTTFPALIPWNGTDVWVLATGEVVIHLPALYVTELLRVNPPAGPED